MYAIKAIVGTETFYGMINIGIRPTVSNELSLHIEAHLFDFNKDIYNQEIEIVFAERLRDEQRFPSLDALKEQLGHDAIHAKRALGMSLIHIFSGVRLSGFTCIDVALARALITSVNVFCSKLAAPFTAVSYTHLDVYKRQLCRHL